MKRNLIFYLYPRKGSIWSWHIDQLLKYKHVFNGRRIVTISIDNVTDYTSTILQRLKPLEAEFSFVQNDSYLGETRHLVGNLAKVSSLNEDEATFYAHAKGVTHGGRFLQAVMMWCEAMYTLNLGSVPAIERALSLYSAAGCFRHFLRHGGAQWCYGGSFYWLKHSTLFSRKWWDIEPSKYGTEGYPGRHLKWGEMARFTPDDVGPTWLYGGGVTQGYIEQWKGFWGDRMHGSVIGYLQRVVTRADVQGKDILEVGSYNVNGTPRVVFAPYAPKSYIGVDQEAGPCVDRVVNATNLVATLGKDSFDVVLSTEMLEHARDWRAAVNSMKSVVKPGGILFITTRGPGFPFHGFPEDHWRYTVPDFQKIFADMEILDLGPDPDFPGIFMKARKPLSWKPTDLSGIHLQPAPQPGTIHLAAPPAAPAPTAYVSGPTSMPSGRGAILASGANLQQGSNHNQVSHVRVAPQMARSGNNLVQAHQGRPIAMPSVAAAQRNAPSSVSVTPAKTVPLPGVDLRPQVKNQVK